MHSAMSWKFSSLDRIIQIVWAINFAIYLGVAVWIGGDAINGRQSLGRYFLSNHGKLTEVSHGVFLYSEIHTYLLWILTFITVTSVIRAWLRYWRQD
jgi:hypothetical protein